MRREKLTGWGRSQEWHCNTATPRGPLALEHYCKSYSTLLARGQGLSYGDASINSQGLTVKTQFWDRFTSWDSQRGLLGCEAGVTLKEILSFCLPRGWFLPVVPGTKSVTIGGAVASDIHGKNHTKKGSIGQHIRTLNLWTADNGTIRCSPESEAEVFWATIGGMGLTGIIQDVEIQLLRVETSFLVVKQRSAKSLFELLALFQEHEQSHEFGVAWLDSSAQSAELGRGVVFLANYCSKEELARASRKPKVEPSKNFNVPDLFPSQMISHCSIKVFNRLYWNLKHTAGDGIRDIDSYFFPLDFLANWNRIYGRKGLLQYQFSIPLGAEEILEEALRYCHRQRQFPSLAVLKSFGPGLGGPTLSFPQAGWTLALDFPIRGRLMETLKHLDRMVLNAEGRVYLAKDSRLDSTTYREMTPNFESWLKIKRRLDPKWRFTSALSTRLKFGTLLRGR